MLLSAKKVQGRGWDIFAGIDTTNLVRGSSGGGCGGGGGYGVHVEVVVAVEGAKVCMG